MNSGVAWRITKPVRAGIFVDCRFTNGASSVGAASAAEYVAPDGAGFILVLSATKMPRLRRSGQGCAHQRADETNRSAFDL